MEFWHKMKKENTEIVKKILEENPKITNDEIQEKFSGTLSQNNLDEIRKEMIECQK